jgi:hypothetical protein
MLNLHGGKPALLFSRGWIDRPGTVQHPDSPSGEASLCVLVVGWGSKEEHEAARATEEFGKAIKPIREHMLPAVKALQMRHARDGALRYIGCDIGRWFLEEGEDKTPCPWNHKILLFLFFSFSLSFNWHDV